MPDERNRFHAVTKIKNAILSIINRVLPRDDWSDGRKWLMDLFKNIIGTVLAIVIGIGISSLLYNSRLQESIKKASAIRLKLAQQEKIADAQIELIDLTLALQVLAMRFYDDHDESNLKVPAKEYGTIVVGMHRVQRRLLLLLPGHKKKIKRAFDPLICNTVFKKTDATSDVFKNHNMVCGYEHQRHFASPMPEIEAPDGSRYFLTEYSTGVAKQYILSMNDSIRKIEQIRKKEIKDGVKAGSFSTGHVGLVQREFNYEIEKWLEHALSELDLLGGQIVALDSVHEDSCP